MNIITKHHNIIVPRPFTYNWYVMTPERGNGGTLGAFLIIDIEIFNFSLLNSSTQSSTTTSTHTHAYCIATG